MKSPLFYAKTHIVFLFTYVAFVYLQAFHPSGFNSECDVKSGRGGEEMTIVRSGLVIHAPRPPSLNPGPGTPTSAPRCLLQTKECAQKAAFP